MDPNNAFFKKLESILAREYEAHEQLLGAAERLGSAVKESDLATLRKCTAGLDDHVSMVARIEDERAEFCTALSASLGLAGRGALRLSAIIDRAPLSLRDRLRGLQASFKTLLRKISFVTVADRVLLEEGQHLVRSKLMLMMPSPARFVNYRQGGARAAECRQTNPFVNKSV